MVSRIVTLIITTYEPPSKDFPMRQHPSACTNKAAKLDVASRLHQIWGFPNKGVPFLGGSR